MNSENAKAISNMGNYYIILKKNEDEFGISNLNKQINSKIKVQPWMTIKELKIRISELEGVSRKLIRLYFKNQELSDKLTVSDYKIIESKKPEIYYKNCSLNQNCYISIFGTSYCHTILKKGIQDISIALNNNIYPKKVIDGTSGTYFMLNSKKDKIAVFKPFDEEAYAPNNQKGYTGSFFSKTFRDGILSGEGVIREYAAYILDENNIFKVPPTTIVEIVHPYFIRSINNFMYSEKDSNDFVQNFLLDHNQVYISKKATFKEIKNMLKKRSVDFNGKNTENDECSYDSNQEDEEDESINHNFSSYTQRVPKKIGSLQLFINSTDIAANYSFSLYSTNDVHKLAILDIRICNCDRNEENILVKKIKDKNTNKYFYGIIPIDHALSFPDCLQIFDYELCWTGWDQITQPLSEKLRKYVLSINIVEDMKKLNEKVKLRENCWKIFRLCNTVLQLGVVHNLNLLDIANLLYKTDYKGNTPSVATLLMEKTDKIFNQINFNYKFSSLFNRVNKKKDFINKSTNKKLSFKKIEKSMSEPNLNALNSKEEIINEEEKNNKYNQKKKDDIKNYKYSKCVFDSVFNQMYFYYFEILLIEEMKKRYPDKYIE